QRRPRRSSHLLRDARRAGEGGALKESSWPGPADGVGHLPPSETRRKIPGLSLVKPGDDGWGSLVMPAEAVLQERLEVAHLLAHETGLRQVAVEHQVHHGADAGGGGDLDRAHQSATDLLRVDLLRIRFLRQAAFAHAG